MTDEVRQDERREERQDEATAVEEAAGEPSAETTLEELAVRLAEAEAKRDEYLADLKRLAADFDNYRKRAARDQESLVARAHERLVKDLLPILDDLDRALEAGEEHDEAKVLDGVRLVRQALETTLAREGLEEIPTDGPFDPHVHEALLTQPAEGAEEGAILQVLQKGYKLGDRVLRPARVIVAQAQQAE